MSKADLFIVEELIKEIKPELQTIVKQGTSKGNNREKYQRIKKRLDRLARWKKEIIALM